MVMRWKWVVVAGVVGAAGYAAWRLTAPVRSVRRSQEIDRIAIASGQPSPVREITSKTDCILRGGFPMGGQCQLS